MTRSLQQAAREIDSDFELGQALKAAVEHQPIDAAMPAFIEASRSIDSDFEQRQVLAKAIGRPGLTAAAAGQIFKAATPGPGDAGIESDFELGQLLKARPRAVTSPTATCRPIWTRRARWNRTSSGATSCRRCRRCRCRMPRMAQIVKLAAGIGSDFERSEAIVGLSRNPSIGTASRKALADAAMGIGSEFERGRALNALTRAGVLTAGQ